MQNTHLIRDFVIRHKNDEWKVRDKKTGKEVRFIIEGNSGMMNFNPNTIDFRYGEALMCLCELTRQKKLVIWCRIGGKKEDILKGIPKYFQKVQSENAFTRMYCSK